jgi:hypothetical protein
MTFAQTLLVACCIGILFVAQAMRSIRIRRGRQMQGKP